MTIPAPPEGFRGPWGFALSKDDHAEALLQHFSLDEVLAFVAAREDVRQIPSARLDAEHDTVPAPSWEVDVDLADLEAT
jgi:hypothetical protein